MMVLLEPAALGRVIATAGTCRRITEDSMKLHALSAIALALACGAAGTASAQPTQEYQFRGSDGSLSPPSTLRMTVTPETAAVQPPPIRDTPQSLEIYSQCRDDADRAAVSSAKMREAVGRCLQDLNQRRAQGQ
jgi:hypothetical protein